MNSLSSVHISPAVFINGLTVMLFSIMVAFWWWAFRQSQAVCRESKERLALTRYSYMLRLQEFEKTFDMKREGGTYPSEEKLVLGLTRLLANGRFQYSILEYAWSVAIYEFVQVGPMLFPDGFESTGHEVTEPTDHKVKEANQHLARLHNVLDFIKEHVPINPIEGNVQ
jgi:hypothetical protein